MADRLNPDVFGAFPEEVELLEERRETCPFDYEKTVLSWGPGRRPSAVRRREAGAKVRVSLEEAGDDAAERELLEQSELLRTIGKHLAETFRLSRDIRMTGKACGELNAFWDPEAGKIIMCCGLIREYKQLHDAAA